MNITETIEWEVETKLIYNEEQEPIKNYKRLVRSDNNLLLNICKKSYTPLHNSSFMKVVEKMATLTKMELSGYSQMDGGKKIISYIDVGDKNIAGYDYKKFMVLGNSHDYSSGFFMASTSEMLRCRNQFSKLYKGRQFSIPHTTNLENNISLLLKRFESWMHEQLEMEENLNRWSKVTIDPYLKSELAKRLLKIESGQEETISTRKANILTDMSRSINSETLELGDNLLGLFQGITHYTTHVLKQKESVYGNIFGSAATLNNNAYSLMHQIESGQFEEELEFSL